MLQHEKEAEERRKQREAKYDEVMAEAKVERALIRYERRTSGRADDRDDRSEEKA